MGKIIGIDLGTTNTVAAIKERDVSIIKTRSATDSTRSVVGVYKGTTYVGESALNFQKTAPKDTILSIKRLMGRGFRDEAVQEAKKHIAYQIIAPEDGTEDDIRVVMGGKHYSPIDISAMILKQVKEDAGSDTEYAVITVPAYFTEKQKDATRKAAQKAGLKVQKILDEPTAAAIAYGADYIGEGDSKTLLVYDLGGGTFDVSVLSIVGSVFVQLDIEGNMWLGGDDFDQKIMEYVLQWISTVHGVDGAQNPGFLLLLKEEAEKAKRVLSTSSKSNLLITGALKNSDGDLIDIDLELSRKQFEQMIEKDVDKSIALVLAAIKNAGEAMTPDDIDQVLLVGGSSYIPLVRQKLAAVFGESKICKDVDPMKAVAYGAAILSAKLGEKVVCSNGHINPGQNEVCEICKEIIQKNENGPEPMGITAMHFGVKTEGDVFSIIIPKGSPYPTPEPINKRFKTPSSNLRRLQVSIYAGFNPVASENDLQATVWLELPDGVPENTPVDVSLSIDGDGILNQAVVALMDGSGVKIESFLSRGDDLRSGVERKLENLRQRKEQLDRDLDEASNLEWEQLYSKAINSLNQNDAVAASQGLNGMQKLLDSNDKPTDWKQKAVNLCRYTEMLIRDYSFLLEPPKIQELKTLKNQLEACVERNDEISTVKAFEALDKATDAESLPQEIMVLNYLYRMAGEADSKGMPAEAQKIRAAARQIESALQKGDYQSFNDILDSIKFILDKLNSGESYRPGKGDVKTDGVLRQ